MIKPFWHFAIVATSPWRPAGQLWFRSYRGHTESRARNLAVRYLRTHGYTPIEIAAIPASGVGSCITRLDYREDC